MAIWLQSSIWANRTKSLILIVSFPVLLFGILFLVFLLLSMKWAVEPQTFEVYAQESLALNLMAFTYLGPILLVWCLISFAFHRQIIFAFSGAKPLERRICPDVYNIVENLCISRGLPMPQIGILEDDSMNAFAVGWRPKNAWIVFSRGLLNTLNKKEVEAVAAHELTHIINRDSLLMVVVICFIGAIATIWEIIVRWGWRFGWSRDSKDSGQIKMAIMVIGFVFLILGYVVFPLVQLALSRKREYLADAGSVELTHDSESMIAALEKISADSVIESINKWTVAAMCIATPFEKKSGFWSWVKNLFSTHPRIEDRISALRTY